MPAIVAALAMLDVWAPPSFVTPQHHRVLLSVVFLADAFALAWRRYAPVAVLVFVFASLTLSYLVMGSAPEALGTFLPPLVAIYSVGRYAEPRALVVAAPVALLGTLAHETMDPLFAMSGPALFFWALLAAAWPVGRAFRLREQAVESLSREAGELRVRQAREAEAAVAAERARIARELHDVVGHGLSVVVLQLVAAQGMLEGGDRPAASQRLVATERSAREALAEMRRLLGLLDEHDASLAPQPSLRDLGRLVEETRLAGVDIDLEVHGEPIQLPPGLELAAYRIVQEALTNVIRHARPARAHVQVACADGRLTVEVRDDGQSLSDPGRVGRGLAGMKERVALYDGELIVGPRPGGGFGVRASFPVLGS